MTYFVCSLAMLIGSPDFSQDTENINIAEVSNAEFAQFLAAIWYITKTEQTGWMVYESGCVRKPDWNWRQPYGITSNPQEPAIHITFGEAKIFCEWRGNQRPPWVAHSGIVLHRWERITGQPNLVIWPPYTSAFDVTGADLRCCRQVQICCKGADVMYFLGK